MNATLGEGFRQIFLVVSADVDDKDFGGCYDMETTYACETFVTRLGRLV